MRYKKLYPAVICFCVFLAAIGLVLGDPSTVLPGLWKIIVTEDALITDYVKIAGDPTFSMATKTSFMGRPKREIPLAISRE